MKIYIILTMCFFTLNAAASKNAVTEEGDVVVLNDDGTWHYQDGKASEEIEISINSDTFQKHTSSNFILKSTKTNSSFAIDSKKWQFKKNKDGAAEYTFDLKGGDLYGMAITEQVEIDVEGLANIAFDNAKSAAPDTQVVKKEYRTVNGHKVIYMEMVGTIQSIKFKYFGYYHSNESGSTQLLAYTGVNLEGKYKTDINNFLNGFSLNL